MSLTKKDPSLRVAANDPHLVSLGGGRLSTAVTIHYIPIGDTTIGSSSNCSISLNGLGIQPVHCTIYRSELNEVILVPEKNARVMLDGQKINKDANLTQGAMLTIGNYNFLRFNNPAEAQIMRSALNNDDEISSQMDFAFPEAHSSPPSASAELCQSSKIERFYKTNIGTRICDDENFASEFCSKKTVDSKAENKSTSIIDINGVQCPKVFTADLVTVNMPAKDVLGQKYANFAKNFAENLRSEKPMNNNNFRNNQQVFNKVNQPSPEQQHPAMHFQTGNYVNIPNSSFYIQNSTQKADGNSSNNIEYLSKVNNTTPLRSVANNIQNLHHDRYPKLGNYGGLQIYPMNGVNTEINNGSTQNSPLKSHEKSPLFAQNSQVHALSASTTENDVLEDMLKICAEYADRQEQNTASNSNSITSSPIVQNRIKTNGSLPREKKSPFHHEHSGSQQQTQAFNTDGIKNSISPTAKVNNPVCSPRTAVGFSYTGYENVRLLVHNRVEINGQLASGSSSSNLSNNTSVSTSNNTNLPTGYENVVVGKYVPQSPRTKIRTNCMSPKKENALCNVLTQANKTPPTTEKPKPNQIKTNDYEQLIKTFEEKLNLEMQAIEESSRYQVPLQQNTSTPQHIPAKRSSKNINNLTLSLQSTHSLQNSPKLNKKPAPAPRNLNRSGLDNCVTLESAADVQNLDGRKPSTDTESQNVDNLKAERKELLATMQLLKVEISELTIQEDEALREVDLEKALVSGELTSVEDSIITYKTELSSLKNKIYRLEAQRNATRVMEENQQAKLKQSIEMKQDQVKKLKAMLKQKPNNACLKEEIRNVSHSLENERKAFEDLEFQYLEEESEWHAYREELHAEENALLSKLEEKQLELQNLRKQELHLPISDAKSIQHRLTDLCSKLKTQQRRVKSLENMICDITGQLHINSSDEDDLENIKSTQELLSTKAIVNNNLVTGMMSQSLFGSAEILFPKRTQEDLMSKSVNENMFYNNNIELPVSTVPNIDLKENSNNNVPPAISTPKRPQLRVVDIVEQLEQMNVNENMHVNGKHSSITLLDVSQADINSQLQKCELKNAGDEENDNEGQNERLKFNLSLGSDDFEVNPLERRVPSQDDIDRICKVTLDAPISTKGASTKIFDSIKEIERNRQLLLAQQGHHVIEHERQKMHDLKKKCHDEARAQYLSMVSTSIERSHNSDIDNINDDSRNSSPIMRAIKNDNATSPTPTASKDQSQQTMQKLNKNEGNKINKENTNPEQHHLAVQNPIQQEDSSQQRRSHPEFANTTNYEGFEEQNQEQVLLNTSRNSRPLSESNSEYCYDALNAEAAQTSSITTATINAFRADKELPAPRSAIKSGDNERQRSCSSESNSQEDKRASVNSNDTSAASGTGSNSDRKRTVPKHQRPLTRYLPIFSPDLNLRHHIETAGHQIGLCPHVFVDAFSCRGYLHKLGATFHGWARRWFVLDRQRCAFIYYADKSERKPRGGAYFSTIDEVYLDHLNASKSGRPHSTFIVKTKKRSYHLQAVSDAAARIWIDAIITGAQGNLHLYPPIL